MAVTWFIYPERLRLKSFRLNKNLNFILSCFKKYLFNCLLSIHPSLKFSLVYFYNIFSIKIRSHKFNNHEDFHFYVSGDVYLIYPFVKIFCCIFHKHEAFHLYVYGDGNLNYLSLKIACYKFDKHEAFHLYVSGDDFLSYLYGEIICCIFHKHEAFHLRVSSYDFSNSLFV